MSFLAWERGDTGFLTPVTVVGMGMLFLAAVLFVRALAHPPPPMGRWAKVRAVLFGSLYIVVVGSVTLLVWGAPSPASQWLFLGELAPVAGSQWLFPVPFGELAPVAGALTALCLVVRPRLLAFWCTGALLGAGLGLPLGFIAACCWAPFEEPTGAGHGMELLLDLFLLIAWSVVGGFLGFLYGPVFGYLLYGVRRLRENAKAIEPKPDDADAHCNRGNVYGDQGEYNLAIRDHPEAIEPAPDDADAHCNRGNVYGDQGEYNLAIRDHPEAIGPAPDDAHAHYNRGNVYGDKGECDLAIRDYTKAIELKPGYAEAYHRRAMAHYHLKAYSKAWADVKKCRQLGFMPNPKFIEGLTKDSGRSE